MTDQNATVDIYLPTDATGLFAWFPEALHSESTLSVLMP